MLVNYLRHLPCARPGQLARTPGPVHYDRPPAKKSPGIQSTCLLAPELAHHDGSPGLISPVEATYLRAPGLVDCDGSPGREEPAVRSTCLLGCGSTFDTKSNLTRHTIRVYIENGTTFQKAFPCPKCRGQQREEFIVTSPAHWARHVHVSHGEQHAPNLYSGRAYRTSQIPKTKPQREKPVGCFFCSGQYVPGQGFSAHFNREYRNKGLFKRPFLCPECRKQGTTQDTTIYGYIEWLSHITEAHGRDGQSGAEAESAYLFGRSQAKGGRKWRNDEIKESTRKSVEMILDPALVKLESEMEILSPHTLLALKKRKRDLSDNASQSFDLPESLSKMRNSTPPSGKNVETIEDSELR